MMTNLNVQAYSVEVVEEVDGNSENNNQSMLRNALQEDVQAGDLQLNFRYLIYYNKCNNVYQLVNAYPANITAPGA